MGLFDRFRGQPEDPESQAFKAVEKTLNKDEKKGLKEFQRILDEASQGNAPVATIRKRLSGVSGSPEFKAAVAALAEARISKLEGKGTPDTQTAEKEPKKKKEKKDKVEKKGKSKEEEKNPADVHSDLPEGVQLTDQDRTKLETSLGPDYSDTYATEASESNVRQLWDLDDTARVSELRLSYGRYAEQQAQLYQEMKAASDDAEREEKARKYMSASIQMKTIKDVLRKFGTEQWKEYFNLGDVKTALGSEAAKRAREAFPDKAQEYQEKAEAEFAAKESRQDLQRLVREVRDDISHYEGGVVANAYDVEHLTDDYLVENKSRSFLWSEAHYAAGTAFLEKIKPQAEAARKAALEWAEEHAGKEVDWEAAAADTYKGYFEKQGDEEAQRLLEKLREASDGWIDRLNIVTDDAEKLEAARRIKQQMAEISYIEKYLATEKKEKKGFSVGALWRGAFARLREFRIFGGEQREKLKDNLEDFIFAEINETLPQKAGRISKETVNKILDFRIAGRSRVADIMLGIGVGTAARLITGTTWASMLSGSVMGGYRSFRRETAYKRWAEKGVDVKNLSKLVKDAKHGAIDRVGAIKLLMDQEKGAQNRITERFKELVAEGKIVVDEANGWDAATGKGVLSMEDGAKKEIEAMQHEQKMYFQHSHELVVLLQKQKNKGAREHAIAEYIDLMNPSSIEGLDKTELAQRTAAREKALEELDSKLETELRKVRLSKVATGVVVGAVTGFVGRMLADKLMHIPAVQEWVHSAQEHVSSWFHKALSFLPGRHATEAARGAVPTDTVPGTRTVPGTGLKGSGAPGASVDRPGVAPTDTTIIRGGGQGTVTPDAAGAARRAAGAAGETGRGVAGRAAGAAGETGRGVAGALKPEVGAPDVSSLPEALRVADAGRGVRDMVTGQYQYYLEHNTGNADLLKGLGLTPEDITNHTAKFKHVLEGRVTDIIRANRDQLLHGNQEVRLKKGASVIWNQINNRLEIDQDGTYLHSLTRHAAGQARERAAEVVQANAANSAPHLLGTEVYQEVPWIPPVDSSLEGAPRGFVEFGMMGDKRTLVAESVLGLVLAGREGVKKFNKSAEARRSRAQAQTSTESGESTPENNGVSSWADVKGMSIQESIRRVGELSREEQFETIVEGMQSVISYSGDRLFNRGDTQDLFRMLDRGDMKGALDILFDTISQVDIPASSQGEVMKIASVILGSEEAARMAYQNYEQNLVLA